MKININNEPPSTVEDIESCFDAVNAKFNGLIQVKILELINLQKQLTNALANCESNYQRTLQGCDPFSILCPLNALEARNQCVYLAQQRYGVCCTTKIGPFPIGGPPCCQSGLCSCTNNLRDPDNIGPQVNKQKEIDNLEQQRQRELQRCLFDITQYKIPSPVSIFLTKPTMRDLYPDLLWYVWRRPAPFSRRKTPPDLDPSVINDPDTDVLKQCLIECWIRYNLGADGLKADLDAFIAQNEEFNRNCKADADTEYNTECPPGSLGVGCGVGGPKWEKREAAKRECDSLKRSSNDEKIKNYNDAMIRLGVALDECLDGCYENFGGQIA